MPDEPTTCAGSPEVVRAIAAHGVPGTTTLELPGEPLEPSAWAGLVQDAADERVLGLLLAAVQRGDLPVTQAQHEDVQRLATDAVRFCLALEGQLLRVAALLSDSGVDLRVLKGPAAAALDYPDPTLRTFVDIDVLVRSDEFDRAAAALVAGGYVREFPQPRAGFDRMFSKGTSLVSPSGLSLDLHRTFVMGPFGLRIDLADLWAAVADFEVGGRPFAALPAELRLLHACYHGALGDWPPRLVPHRDIAQILLGGGCDEGRVREISHRWRGDAVLARSIVAAWRLLGLADSTPLTSWAHQFEASDADRRDLDLYSRADHSYAALSVGALKAIPGVRAKAAFVRALALPDRSYLAGRHDSRAARLRGGARQLLSAARRLRR